MWKIKLFLLLQFVNYCTLQEFGELADLHVGCYRDNPESRDLDKRLSGDLNSIDKCIEACTDNYYRYAGLQNGRVCYCGSEYGKYGPGQCDIRCEGNTDQICGGLDSNTVYKTGEKVAGPPENLRKSAEPTNSSIYIEWERPRTGANFEYVVTTSLHFSYNTEGSRFTDKLMRLSSNMTTAVILGLVPGSQFNVTIHTESEAGVGPAVSGLFWTEVGTPKMPSPPTIVPSTGQNDGIITIKVSPVEEYYGPITLYQIIVIDETLPTVFDTEMLYNYTLAQNLGLNYWIAAELDPDYLLTHEQFNVGDNFMYRGYQNHGPLLKRHYHIILGAVSQLNGITKTSYARVTHDQHAINEAVVFDFPEEESQIVFQQESSSGDNTALIVCIVVALVVLFVALAFFIFVRKNLGQKIRRRRADTQELTTNNTPSSAEAMENGFVDNNGYIEETGAQFRTREDYLQSLEGKVWQVPRNFVDIQNEVLGRGKFGTVMNGTVVINGEQENCNVYSVPNKMIDDDERKLMLKDVDMNVKAKFHDNIVNLIGICEEVETTLFILDALEVEMKQYLLDSRCLEHQPGYADRSERFSTMREDTALGIMAGIAKGLGHLVNSGVQVKELSSRTIYITGGWQPKIFGFGIADYSKRAVSLDFTRWSSPETLLKRQYSSKSLAWSYGCVMWEIVTLGATPYPELRTGEVKARILQGLRLPSTEYLSDQLYQLMLTCWMTDPSERPDFTNILESLTLMMDEQMVLSFNIRQDFKYERYLPELEHISSS